MIVNYSEFLINESKDKTDLYWHISKNDNYQRISKERILRFVNKDIDKINKIIINILKTQKYIIDHHTSLLDNYTSFLIIFDVTNKLNPHIDQAPMTRVTLTNNYAFEIKLRKYKDDWFSLQRISPTGFMGARFIIDGWDGLETIIKDEINRF